MANPNKDINHGKKGMNSDAHSSQLSEQEYNFMLNGNYEDQNGNSIMLQNEHSNILCSKFKEDFKVVGIQRDLTGNKTYYFLYNVETNCSEIGYIEGMVNITNIEDVEVECGCDVTQIMADPLENQEQPETCSYVTVVSDCCEGDLVGQRCLGFDIRYPISSELKDEKCGKVLYFTDDFNDIRRVELDNLEQYSTVEEFCDDCVDCDDCDNCVECDGCGDCQECNPDCECGVTSTPVCLNCDKMRLFKHASIPCFSDKEVISGGNLREGIYVGYIAYCDKDGNEVTRYYSITGEIPIKDANKNIYQQPELDRHTNFSIKFTIRNLDVNHPYYKVVIMQRTSVDGAVSYYEAGVYPTSRNEVLYSNSDEDKRIADALRITAEFPHYLTAKTIESANNALHINDLTAQSEVNLQPVVNFIGQFGKWRTFIAEEDVYNNPKFVERFRTYMRNEVYPLSIRFGSSTYVTANFPLISRAATDSDLYFDGSTAPINVEEIITNGDNGQIRGGFEKDVYSILKHTDVDCVEQERKYKWQYYNTADRYCSPNCFDLNFDLIDVVQKRTCETEFNSSCTIDSNGGIVIEKIPDDYEYVDFIEYLNDFPDSNVLPACMKASTYEGESNCCDDPNSLFVGNCGDATFVPSESIIEVLRLDGSFTENIFYKECGHYDALPNPQSCNYIEIDSNGEIVNLNNCLCSGTLNCKKNADKCSNNEIADYCCDWEYVSLVGDSCHKSNVVFDRTNPIYGGTTCASASPLPIDSDFLTPTHIMPVFDDGSNEPTIISNLQSGVSSPLVDNNANASRIKSKCKGNEFSDQSDVMAEGGKVLFTDEIHKGAVWFKVTSITEAGIVIRISDLFDEPKKKKEKDCLLYPEKFRYHIFKRCTSELVSYGFIKDGYSCSLVNTVGANINFNETLYITSDVFDKDADGNLLENELIVVIDAPLMVLQGTEYDCDDSGGAISGVESPLWMGYTLPSYNCFSIGASSPVVDRVEINGDAFIVFNSVCTYESTCIVKEFDNLKCDPSPWHEGKFAYWESTDTYPNNQYLYDSSNLVIKPSTLQGIVSHTDSKDCGDVYVKDIFESIFTNGVDEDGNYILNDNADFRCKPIRHFKMPSNCVAPFHDGVMEDGGITAPFSRNKVFPLGVHINNDIINLFLDIAVENDLITQEFRDSIKYYEIFRGDTRLHKSIIGKGMVYDSWEYEENNTTHQFANFPFNDNRDNKLIYTDAKKDKFLEHPHKGEGNNKFFFHSPEFSFEKPNVPFEFEVESYLLGDSRGNFAEVEDHPTMVILSDKAYRVAKALAAIESFLELATDITDRLIDAAVSSYVGYFQYNWGQALAWTGFALFSTQRIIEESLIGGKMKTYEWLKIFDDNGLPNNFASYYTALGHYNKMSCQVPDGDKLRGLLDSKYLKSGRYSYLTKNGVSIGADKKETININHFNRVSSVFLYLGDYNLFGLDHSQTFKNYDNSRLNSDGTCFLTDLDDARAHQSPDLYSSLYSPYVSMKRYLPSQYGQIDDISWISVNYCGYLDSDNSCDAFFGGDSFISRFTYKRHFPFFINPMITSSGALADLSPFSYTNQRNIGFPRYFIDYKVDSTDDGGAFEMPTIRSNYNLDCFNAKRMYVTPPSKFYLWYYGITNHLVESRINLNFRYGENNKERDFYPNQTDIIKWTQENNVSNREDNYFFYNNIFSTENDLYAFRTLPANYNPEEWDCRFDHWDRTIYSEEDNSEQDVIDKWQVYKANNYYDFGNKYGKFYGLKNIESQKVIGRFENGVVIFNAFNTIQGTVEDIQIGTGGRFKTRPTEFFRSDLGYGGTQHRAMVSCEFGHYWTDAMRGRVFSITPTGGGLDEISRYGMKNWFRENLPFRIKKQFPEIPSDMLDNTYRGLGITMAWDDRYSRLFITKRDVILKDKYIGKVRVENLNFIYRDDDKKERIIETSDAEYFTDSSWTIAWNPATKSWVSYYSFKPNYYVEYNNYFQTGLNWGEGQGVWSHLLSNKSFQVYYGTLYPWTIDLPITNKLVKKWYEDFEYKLDVRRYVNEYDYAHRGDGNFNKAVVYTNRESSGYLNLINQIKNNQYQFIQYPKHNVDSTDILVGMSDQRFSFNYFFDLVKDNHNSNIWLYDDSNVDKTLNQGVFNYKATFKNHLRGDWGNVRLTQDKESRLKFIFEHIISNNKVH